MTVDDRQFRLVAKRIAIARKTLDAAMDAGKQVAVTAHADEGTPETELARKLGVNRMTVRRWLGKL